MIGPQLAPERPTKPPSRRVSAAVAYARALALVGAALVSGCSDDSAAGNATKADATAAASDALDGGPATGDASGPDGNIAAQNDGVGSEGDTVDLSDAATPEGCPGKPGCPCTDNASCDDGDACTADDTCVEGFCGFPAPTNCDDGNVCTDDSCDPAAGCTATDAPPIACSDDNVCTLDDACAGGVCSGGGPRNCDDGNVCTTDICEDGLGCAHVQNQLECRPENPCVEAAICSFGGCPANPLKPCDDKNPCTYDFCTPATGCETLPLPSPATSCDGQEKWGRCFAAFAEKTTWLTARKRCQAWGGELVSVTDPYDNAFVRTVADQTCGKKGAWIGLTDVSREWTFRWSDGTPYQYRAWNKGEPNNAGNEDYTELGANGLWNDVNDKTERECLVCSRKMVNACSDGNACTGNDACALASMGTGTEAVDVPTCATGTQAVQCDDNSPCTLDACSKTKGCTYKTAPKGTSCAAGTCAGSTCYWPENKAFSSCKAALEQGLKTAGTTWPNGVYWLVGADANGNAIKYQARCEMAGEWGGGWTLALQSDGAKATFAWAAKLWTDKVTHNDTKPPWLNQDAKLASYWNVAGTEALVLMRRGTVTRGLTLPLAATANDAPEKSLHDVIAPGKHLPTTLDYKQWRQLIANSSLQNFCHAQGFNTHIKGGGRARIGILGNNEPDCNSPDSWLGVGGQEKMCGNTQAKSTGNVACYEADKGTRRWPAFAWVWVR